MIFHIVSSISRTCALLRRIDPRSGSPFRGTGVSPVDAGGTPSPQFERNATFDVQVALERQRGHSAHVTRARRPCHGTASGLRPAFNCVPDQDFAHMCIIYYAKPIREAARRPWHGHPARGRGRHAHAALRRHCSVQSVGQPERRRGHSAHVHGRDARATKQRVGFARQKANVARYFIFHSFKIADNVIGLSVCRDSIRSPECVAVAFIS